MNLNLRIFAGCIFLFLVLSQCSELNTLVKNTPANSTTRSDNQLRNNIVEFALNQKGARYKYAGRNPKTGFDCSGFTHYVFAEFNVNLTPVSRAQEAECRKIPLKNAQTGDLVFFRKSKAGSVFHVALVVSNDASGITVVHSTSSRGVISENITTSSYWRSKVTTACDVLNK
ncbi:MAG: hydrolase [Bacteroidetes bacterium]|nr:MAG: hydrolase [Bacteroidota bacterium]PTM09705.1 MAG: hydrolase [Bacteroidota bacterium]